MFTNKRYMTKGIAEGLEPGLIELLWCKIDELREQTNGEMDYLQVFDLKSMDAHSVIENQLITHSSECPAYEMSFVALVDNPVDAKVFVVDSSEESTMMFANEY